MDPNQTTEFSHEQSAERSKKNSQIPCLFEVSGEMPGRTYTLTSPIYLIGREEACAVQLDLEGVSRRHCELVQVGSGYEIRDLDSTNGTFVNGNRVETRVLAEGDRIALGPKAVYTYRVYHFDEGTALSQISEGIIRDPISGAITREHLLEWMQSQLAVAGEQRFEIALLTVSIAAPEEEPADFARQVFECLNTVDKAGLQVARLGGLQFALAFPYSRDGELRVLWQPLAERLEKLGQFCAGLATTRDIPSATPDKLMRDAAQKLRLAQFDIPNSLVR